MGSPWSADGEWCIVGLFEQMSVGSLGFSIARKRPAPSPEKELHPAAYQGVSETAKRIRAAQSFVQPAAAEARRNVSERDSLMNSFFANFFRTAPITLSGTITSTNRLK